MTMGPSRNGSLSPPHLLPLPPATYVEPQREFLEGTPSGLTAQAHTWESGALAGFEPSAVPSANHLCAAYNGTAIHGSPSPPPHPRPQKVR